jgi:hypothetical protein
MSGNPNMQKIGKRKAPPGSQNPTWLFPAAEKPMSTKTNVPVPSKQSKIKHDKKIADDLVKRRAAGESSKYTPPAELVDLVCMIAILT